MSLKPIGTKRKSLEELEYEQSLAAPFDDSLISSLGRPSPERIAQVQSDLEDSGEIIKSSNTANTAKNEGLRKTGGIPKGNLKLENVLIDLYSLYDELIISFEGCELNSNLSNRLEDHIKVATKCIRSFGGEVDSFDKFSHMSGLSLPDQEVNAKKVIATTYKCYKIGNILKASVDSNAVIHLLMEGFSDRLAFRVNVSVEPLSGWEGNEAIDYIHTSDGGKISIKTFSKGRWKDISEDYVINGEVEEYDIEEYRQLMTEEDAQKEGEEDEIIDEATDAEIKEQEDIDSDLEEDLEYAMNELIDEEIDEQERSNLESELNEDEDDDIGDFPIDDKN